MTRPVDLQKVANSGHVSCRGLALDVTGLPTNRRDSPTTALEWQSRPDGSHTVAARAAVQAGAWLTAEVAARWGLRARNSTNEMAQEPAAAVRHPRHSRMTARQHRGGRKSMEPTVRETPRRAPSGEGHKKRKKTPFPPPQPERPPTGRHRPPPTPRREYPHSRPPPPPHRLLNPPRRARPAQSTPATAAPPSPTCQSGGPAPLG